MIGAAMKELNVQPCHIPSKDNPADQLTKPLRVGDVVSQAKLVVHIERDIYNSNKGVLECAML